jgi:hypothetical protein
VWVWRSSCAAEPVARPVDVTVGREDTAVQDTDPSGTAPPTGSGLPVPRPAHPAPAARPPHDSAQRLDDRALPRRRSPTDGTDAGTSGSPTESSEATPTTAPATGSAEPTMAPSPTG